MDSLMVASNIKRLTRMELLYTCLSDFIVYLHKQNDDDKLKGLEHYYDPADYNKVIYRQLAKSKNIEIVTTDLLGKDAKDIYADFQFSEDETRIVRCPAGYQPKSSSLVKSTGKVRASFHKNKCENCPYKDQCAPKISNKTSAVYVSKASHERAKSKRFTETWQFKLLSKVRNGVETIPSTLRRKYDIDTMPVRGKIRMKHLFGFKIGALNFRKLLKYLDSLEKCALNPEIA